MARPELKPMGSRRWVWAYMADVATPSSAFAIAPCRGRIVKAGTVAYGVTNGNAAFTLKIAGTAVTGAAWTIATTGAAGDVDSATPTAKSTTYVNEGDNIEFITDGAGSTVVPAMCWAEIEMD